MNFHVWLSEAESLFAAAAIEDALAGHGDGHEAVGLRCDGIGDEVTEELQGVAEGPRLGIADFEVQMGAGAMTGIAADGDEVASADGELRRWENQRERILRTGALQQGFVLRGEALQVAIDAGMAVGMADVDGIAEAEEVDGESRHVAVGDGEDVLAFLIVGLDIYAAMEMVGSRLTEIAGKDHIVVHGTLIL